MTWIQANELFVNLLILFLIKLIYVEWWEYCGMVDKRNDNGIVD